MAVRIIAERCRASAAHLRLVLALWCATVGPGPATPPALAAGTAAATGDVIVFAAASLQTALDELQPTLAAAAGGRVRISLGATSALARQIEQGAPASIFVSADREWMDYVAQRGLIRRDSRVDLLGNRLVLVAPRDRGTTLRIGPGFGLRAALGDGRLAIADPAAVPAGKYARDALTSLGVWSSVADRLAPAGNVRAALLFVARGEARLGIVYDTDARADTGVRVVGTFPVTSHAAIVYPAALTSTATSPAARRVFEALLSPAAAAVFARQGFLVRPSR